MKKGRPKKIRYVQKMPAVDQFSPRGKPGRPDEMELKIDQYEALKIADHQGYNQSEGASLMGISRPTFGRILREARKIIADALVGGKIIRIRTADIQVGLRSREVPHKFNNFSDGKNSEEKIRENMLKFLHKNERIAQRMDDES